MKSLDLRYCRSALLLVALATLAACDGDSSDPPNNPPLPTVTLAANPVNISAGQTSTLTWSSANATACTASQGWSGSKPTSGTEVVGPLGSSTSFTLICTGNGGASTPATATVTIDAPVGSVTISGVISFERVPFKATGMGLDPNAPVVSPAREVVVEVLDALNLIRLGSAVTDSLGAYSIVAPQNRNVVVRARAEMVKQAVAPTWNFRVLDNTTEDALYTIQGDSFNTGTASSTRNLRALSGWNGTTYDDTKRAAGPFAILDTVYRAKQLVLSAAPTTDFEALDLFWSPENRTVATPFCPDDGNIGTSFYTPSGSSDDCLPMRALPGGIYILGAYAGGNGDTDEFDQHVIAHEFGHYFEDQFSRSDSLGGPHGPGDRLDLRVAFGEGWGNAYSAMTLNDPSYRDSFNGITSDFGFSVETDSNNAEGWFSEASIGEIIWDIFDSTAAPEVGDSVTLGFTPIFATMIGSQTSTDAMTSIFSFATAIRSDNGPLSAEIGTLLTGEDISGTDAFGTGETNAGGNPAFLPVYNTVTINAGPVTVCVRPTEASDEDNQLGDSKLIRLNHTGTAFAVSAIGAAGPFGTAAADPDIFLYRQGIQVGAAFSADPGSETLGAAPRIPGVYVIEVTDFEPGVATLRCMTVSVTGT